MSAQNDDRQNLSRRSLLKLVGAGAATALPLAGEAQSHGHAHGHAPATPLPAGAALPAGYTFLNLDEAAFIEAAIDTLIPSDETGPGALELEVAVFIDRQMSGGYGRGDRLYLQGPFQEGTPQQGYQLRMTPSELLQAGIADTNQHVKEQYQTSFDLLDVQQRAAVLTALETDQIELASVPTRLFFNLLYDLTLAGYFADPIHGGNKGKGSWKMVGFPGIGEMYADKIAAWRNRRFMSEPLSIQDLI